MLTNYLNYLSITLGIIIGITSCGYIDESDTPPEAVQTFELIGNPVLAEGIAIDQRNGVIYTGNFLDGSLQRTENGISDFFLEAGNSKVLSTVVGLDIDESRNRIWICSNDFSTGNSRITAIDLTTKEVIASFDKDVVENAPQDFPTFFNDVITDRKGNAYITNSSTNTILTVPTTLSGMEIFTSNFPEAPTGNFYTINGIEITPNGQFLIVNSFASAEGSIAGLFRINRRTKENTAIAFSEEGTMDFTTTGGDGLSFVHPKKMFCVTLANSIVSVRFSKNYTEASITNATQGTPAEPEIIGCATSAVYKRKLYTTNAQLFPFFRGEPLQTPFQVIEIPFSTLN